MKGHDEIIGHIRVAFPILQDFIVPDFVYILPFMLANWQLLIFNNFLHELALKFSSITLPAAADV